MAAPTAVRRTRHPVGPKSIWMLRACGFRYSQSRNAYVLRVVGNRIGPVFKVRGGT